MQGCLGSTSVVQKQLHENLFNAFSIILCIRVLLTYMWLYICRISNFSLLVKKNSILLSLFRQEDAQEFLSYVMHQMHDELLKLEGQVSSSNGGQSSMVSSAEDDEWETVGRKNKSAITRTQNFVPTELSSIFGGQLRSVVRARGREIWQLAQFSSLKVAFIAFPSLYVLQEIKPLLLFNHFSCFILRFLMKLFIVLRMLFVYILPQKHLRSTEHQQLER